MSKNKHYINTKRPNIDLSKEKETKVTHNETTHGIMDGKKPERFSKLKKRLEKKTA